MARRLDREGSQESGGTQTCNNCRMLLDCFTDCRLCLIVILVLDSCGFADSVATVATDAPLKEYKKKKTRRPEPAADLPLEVRTLLLEKVALEPEVVDVTKAPPAVAKQPSPVKPATKKTARRRRFAPKRRVADKFQRAGKHVKKHKLDS